MTQTSDSLKSAQGRASPPAAPLRLRFLRWLPLRNRRLPSIDPESLSDHLLRDVGLAEGRASPPRDPMRD